MLGKVGRWGSSGLQFRHNPRPEKSQDRKGRTTWVGWKSKLFGRKNVLCQAFSPLFSFSFQAKTKKLIKDTGIKRERKEEILAFKK